MTHTDFTLTAATKADASALLHEIAESHVTEADKADYVQHLMRLLTDVRPAMEIFAIAGIRAIRTSMVKRYRNAIIQPTN